MSKKGLTPKRAERCQKVIDMHSRLGMSFREIAKKLEVSVTQVQNDYRAGIRETFRATAEEHVQTELARLGDVHRNFMPIMLDRSLPTYERAQAAKLVLQASEAKRRLLGLDGAIKFEVSTTENAALAELADAVKLLALD